MAPEPRRGDDRAPMTTTGRPRRMRATRREGEQVTPLELFFDLVFVLAITQCTALMADNPTWTGVLKGLAVLAVLWWSWVGYAWLTSVVDPEEGAVRLVIFAAMAALLVAALCVPEAFGDLGLTFAVAYGVVRGLADRAVRDRQPGRARAAALRRSGSASAPRSASACSWRRRSSTAGPRARCGPLAIVLDVGEPYLFGVEGWQLHARALRRAPRADHHHRPRRVDRRHRRRAPRPASTPA